MSYANPKFKVNNPSLPWLDYDSKHKRSILQLCPKWLWNPFCNQHTSNYVHHCSTFPFYHTVLMWCVGISQLPFDTLFLTEHLAIRGGKLSFMSVRKHLMNPLVSFSTHVFKSLKHSRAYDF